jgi:drug/metabolite transporter (DMT)-like permease
MSVSGGADVPSPPDGRTRSIAILLVTGAAILWSTSGIAFRLIEHADRWQVVFWRSASLVPFIFAVAVWRKGGPPSLAAFRSAGWLAVFAGFCLGCAFAFWILALAETSVASAVFILSASPLVAVLLGRLFLKEPVGRASWIAIVGVLTGALIITAGEITEGRVLGNLFALVAVFGFSGYTVAVRVRRHVDMLPAVFFAGLFSALAGALVTGGNVGVSLRDLWLCLALGVGQIGLGLAMFSKGARYLPAVELMLLSLVEVVLAPVWVWVFLGEQMSVQTAVGGFIMLLAVAFPPLSQLAGRGFRPLVSRS